MIELNKEDQALHDIFHGEDKPLHPDTVHITLGGAGSKKATTNTTHPKKEAQKATESSEDSKWEPVKPDANWLNRMKACAVWAVGFGSLNFLIFYWQMAGLMDDSIAIPCMWVCCLLAGIGIGKNAFGRVR